MRIACVWSGDKYPLVYVERLLSMARRHTVHPFRFVVLTDRPSEVGHLPETDVVDVTSYGLTGWWPKMLLFDPEIRGEGRTIYFDLDTVITGLLTKLVYLEVPFGICANFTRAAGNTSWPCQYGSAVMTFEDGWGADVFDAFWARREEIMDFCGRYGDQKAIEGLVDNAVLLQEKLPGGFFAGRRDLTDEGPGDASVLVFAGPHKPHNSPLDWVEDYWR